MLRSGGTWLHKRLFSHFECLVSRRVKSPFRDVLALKWHTRCSRRQHAPSAKLTMWTLFRRVRQHVVSGRVCRAFSGRSTG